MQKVPSSIDFIRLGKVISHNRNLVGMTQDQLAERVAVTKRHLGGVETGEPFSIDLLFKLVKVLGIPGDEVFRPAVQLDSLRRKRAITTNLLLKCTESEINVVISVLVSMLENMIPGNIPAVADEPRESLLK